MLQMKLDFDGKTLLRIKKFVNKYPKLTSAAVKQTAMYAKKEIIRSTPNDSGMARRSYEIKRIDDFNSEIGNKMVNPPYPLYLEKGTGIYGKNKKEITPKKGKFLKFPVMMGNTILCWTVVKSVKGIKPIGMIKNNKDKIKNKMIELLGKNIRGAWGKA